MTGGIQVLALAADLQALIEVRPMQGFLVHSVFDHAANLLTGDDLLVTLLSRDRDMTPLGLIADVPSLADLDLREGDRLVLDGRQSLILPRQTGRLILTGAKTLPVRLESAKGEQKVSPPALELIQKKLILADSAGIAPLASWLPQGQDLPDKAGNVYCAFIGRDLKAFLDDLEAGESRAALDKASRLIGFGPGLTPACDDFLAGILLWLYYRGADPAFGRQMARQARDRTTLVSAHMISHAAAGRANGLYLALIKAALEGDLDRLADSIDRVLAYGASSGADFLFGFYAAASLGASEASMVGLVPQLDKIRKIS